MEVKVGKKFGNEKKNGERSAAKKD